MTMGDAGDTSGRRAWGRVVLVVAASLAVLAAIAAMPFLVEAGYESVARHRFFARAPLLSDLPGPDDAGAAFADRVARAFPAGTPVAEMKDALVRQGFAPAPSGDAAEAEFSGSGCRTVWDVTWTADAAGRVTSVSGRQARACT